MKYFILLILFIMVSCGAHNPPRNAELSVTYEGEIVHRAGGKWITESELVHLLETQTKPVRVIFSTDYCPPCKRLEKFIKDGNLGEHVVWANAQDEWVKKLSHVMRIEIYPTMIVVNPEGGDIRFDGVKQIAFHLVDLVP